MSKALIVFATRTGETKQIAELIGEGLRFSGAEVSLFNVVSGSLRLKSSSLGGGIKMAQDYGREMAKKLGL